MGWPSHADVDRWFTYQKPPDDAVVKLRRLREKARELGHLILEVAPLCADQSAALRQLRETVMTANAAIVCPQRSSAPAADK